MSYSRWGYSCWYSFYHASGFFSLWGCGEETDWTPEEAKELTEQKIIDHYGCTSEEAKEAMQYVAKFNADYAEEND